MTEQATEDRRRLAGEIAQRALQETTDLVGISTPSGDAEAAEAAVGATLAMLPAAAEVERIPCSSPDHAPDLLARLRGTGTKRIVLVPPHHDEFLYVREANPVLFGSPFDPERPDFDTYPLARAAAPVECIVEPGAMLYVPAGWYHQVRALTFALSVNRWARAMPLALKDDPSLRRPPP